MFPNTKFWIGVIEDTLDDPMKRGRVRVRIFGIHTDIKNKNEQTGVGISTKELPLALPVMPLSYGGGSGSTAPVIGAVEGSWVIGITTDGDLYNDLLILGVIPVLDIRAMGNATTNAFTGPPQGLASLANDLLNVPESYNLDYNSQGDLGSLSAQFESNGDISAIGYDSVGGTSYGKYQIASNTGTYDDFIAYLEVNDPDIANRLILAGEANTGSTEGTVPDVWKQIAEEQPSRFEFLQEDFIKQTHYDPVIENLSNYNIDLNSPVIQQVIWSTGVQHGASGATAIFEEVLLNNENISEVELITEVYDIRATKFSSSNTNIQQAAKNRMEYEKNIAISMIIDIEE